MKMQINDIVNFQQYLKYDVKEGEQVVAYVAASLDKTNLQYSFNIQIFNKEYYGENQEQIDMDIIQFYKGISEYLSPSSQANLFRMMSQSEEV